MVDQGGLTGFTLEIEVIDGCAPIDYKVIGVYVSQFELIINSMQEGSISS